MLNSLKRRKIHSRNIQVSTWMYCIHQCIQIINRYNIFTLNHHNIIRLRYTQSYTFIFQDESTELIKKHHQQPPEKAISFWRALTIPVSLLILRQNKTNNLHFSMADPHSISDNNILCVDYSLLFKVWCRDTDYNMYVFMWKKQHGLLVHKSIKHKNEEVKTYKYREMVFTERKSTQFIYKLYLIINVIVN